MKKSLLLLLLALAFIQCSKNRMRRHVSGAGSSPAATGELDEHGNPIGTDAATQEKLEESRRAALAQAGKGLVWKRYRALETGLMASLGLSKEDLCKEIGVHSCIDKVHLTFLGGNEPIVNGLYERAQAPSVLTAVALDRIVLYACQKRLELDAAAGANAQVFKFFALSTAKPSDDKIKQQAVELYQRLLARDPEAAELQAISTFGASAAAGDKIALSLCYAIGTSAENIFL
ncbi:MAG: hypothetical protein NTX25_11550 [Proteobacteria bacterium]|nr:hypothetical protein [Pseudomonadota bacterium]